jgi:serine/threonine-protein kinase
MHQDPSPTQPDWLDAHQASVGRYVLGPILGLGGAGEVREAWDVVLCRTVALKVLRKMEPVGLIRFMHEAQIQSRIAHPNICRIYDVDNSGGIPKIAMQLVRGPTLSQVAHELTVKEVVVILAQVAEAIHAAHRLNLIHRDLKPSNILLERSPEGRWTPVVCDFGLAMALDEPSLTLGPGLLGTPAFMAPEQSRGERRLVGPATDVYALGATLHFALFGDPPALDPEGSALPRRGGLSASRSPSPDLPRDLETILCKCLERDPGLRYPTAMALAEDLWLFADGAPIRARPVSALEHRWRQLRQYRMVVLAVLLAAAAVLTGRLVEKGRLTRRQRQRAQAEQYFALEAADMEKELRLEKMMPLHDMRPAYAQLRARMAAIRARMAAQGPAAQAPGHYALGCAQLLLRDYAGARHDLDQAWSLGAREPDVAWYLARSLTGAAFMATNPAIYSTGFPPPGREQLAEQVQALLAQARGAKNSSSEYADALLAFVRQDYRRCAASAHACFLAHPWQFEAATLESLALSSQGRAQFDRGDLQGAEASYREAMAAAEHFLVFGHSDEFTYHAYFIAAQRLAFLLASRGRLTLSCLDDLRTTADWVMILDPSEPELQDDWLQFGLIKAYRLRDLGRDPGPELAAVRMFLDTRAQEPLTVELRADRMLVHWRLAELACRRGRDPVPELALALKDPGHTRGFRHRDFLGEILNFKARLEMRQGLDPRPTVAEALDRQAPQPEHAVSWTLCETAAESWLIQARWEAGHGLDARASLRSSRTLVDQALKINPGSGSGHALKGLTLALEARLQPGGQPDPLEEARDQLRLASALAPPGRLQAALRRALGQGKPGRPGTEADLLDY